jgi:hypothetical protein
MGSELLLNKPEDFISSLEGELLKFSSKFRELPPLLLMPLPFPLCS